MAKLQTKPREGYVKCAHCDAFVKDTERSKNAHIGYHHKEIAVERFRQPIAFTMACSECGQLVANSANVLGRHVRKAHSMEWIDYVVKHEHGGVRPTCACGCGREVAFRKGGFDRFYSKNCANSGDRNPMSLAVRPVSPNRGKVRTEEHIERYKAAAKERWRGPTGEKVREIFKSEEYSKKQSEAQQIVYSTTNHAEKISRGINRFWNEDPRADELRVAASDRACVLLEQNKIGPRAPFKAQWVYNPFVDREEYMHSSYETEFLRRCVEEGKPVAKQHDIKVPYVNSKGNPARYVPDFVSYHSREIHEVKGQHDEDDDLKIKAAEAWCQANGWKYVFHGAEEFK